MRTLAKVDVCAVEELAPGTMRGIAVGEERRIVVANVEGELRAFSGICTHAYAELDGGFLRDGRVMCPLHFSEFDTATGEALGPPAEEALETYPVKVEAGRVVVEVPP
jgi:nitrite reductase/ring-hydroxylating ferredoxin subunit